MRGTKKGAGCSGALVVAHLERSQRPLGAYELAKRISVETGIRQHANTIYRTLDKLIAAGRVIHVASLKTYMVTRGGTKEAVMVLLCSACGAIRQLPAGGPAEQLRAIAAAHAFRPRRIYLEMKGVCALCRADDHRPALAPA